MEATLAVVFLVLVTLSLTVTHGRGFEGDVCRLADGSPAVCTKYSSCPWAADQQARTLKVNHCSFDGFEPIVCCPRNGVETASNNNDLSITQRVDVNPSTRPSYPRQYRPTNWQTTRRTPWPTARPTPWQTARPTPRPTARPTSRPIARPTTRPTTRPTFGFPNTGNAQSGGSKAIKMCKEYARYVVKEVRLPVLLLNAPKFNSSKCPITSQTLIVGGVKAEPNEFPHMAALGYGDEKNIEWRCGGTLISERFVLTAAHCISSGGSTVRWVRLGDLNLVTVTGEKNAETIAVASTSLFEGYKPPARYHDIALLKLARDVTLNLYIRPACLYTNSGNPPNLPNATAIGWGKTDFTSEVISDDLMKVDLTLQPESNCNYTYRQDIKNNVRLNKQGITSETMICAGTKTKDTCSGDSGGPLLFRLKDPYCMQSIFGLTSFGVYGCGKGSPAVYTRVSNYISWIENIVWP